MKYYKVITLQDYSPEESGTYVPFEWKQVPQEVLNSTGVIHTIYGSTEPYSSMMVILAKPCRQRKTQDGYKIDQDTLIYL